jgi:hypothetical protein
VYAGAIELVSHSMTHTHAHLGHGLISGRREGWGVGGQGKREEKGGKRK